jgi:hypothetical protein
MNQALILFLYRFPLWIGRGHSGRQAWQFLLDHVLSSAHGHELTF